MQLDKSFRTKAARINSKDGLNNDFKILEDKIKTNGYKPIFDKNPDISDTWGYAFLMGGTYFLSTLTYISPVMCADE